jgi:hypothetical protein
MCLTRNLHMVVLMVLTSPPSLIGQVDARAIIRKSVAADERNWRIARAYTSLQRVELRRLDSQGRLKSSEVKTYEITFQEGTPYTQLVQRDDRPLTATEEKKEQERFARSVAERRQETTAERAKRLSAYERRSDWQREAWAELAEAFDFSFAGEARLDDTPAFVIDATPRDGYQPRSHTAKLFRSLKARFWVDLRDHQIVKVEAEVTDTIWMGLFLVRVAKGSRATLELTRAGDGVWLPDRLHVVASARLGLLKTYRFEQRVQYSGYSCVPANERTVAPAEVRKSSAVTVNRPSKRTSQ